MSRVVLAFFYWSRGLLVSLMVSGCRLGLTELQVRILVSTIGRKRTSRCR
jgi:hypothetical protein